MPQRLSALIASLAVAAGAAAVPSPAVAGPKAHLTRAQAMELAYETAVLGRAHALEHLRERRAATRAVTANAAAAGQPCGPRSPAIQIDTSVPPPPPEVPTGQNRCLPLPKQPTSKAALARLGRWERASIDLPHYAIHAVLLPTGKVMFWGFEWTRALATKLGSQVGGRAAIWDPAKGTGARSIRLVPPPLLDVNGDGILENVPIYCSGQSLLPDGRVLVTGGTLDAVWYRDGYKYPPGHRIALLFDPLTETWARGPDMSVGRWYPSLTELPDGRTLILGGFDDNKPNGLSSNLDVVARDGKTITHVPSGDRKVMLYPAMSLLPDGNVLLAGPFPQDSALLDPRTMRWTQAGTLPTYRGGANIVPLPTSTGSSPRVELIGGTSASGYFDGRNQADAIRSTLVFDSAARHPRWVKGSPQVRARHYPNTVLLPDGSMVTVGGSKGITPSEGNYTPDPGNRHVELWDPRTQKWTLGPQQREDRTYHSVALLLPDGRVWSAGDDANPNRDGDTAEIYDPPYLFRGARPRITAVPRRIAPRRRFTVTVTGDARRVTLVAPSAVTHAIDMHQRFVELRVVARAGHRLTVVGPRSANVAPPGRWMLFALDARGVPSRAAWVSVG